MSFMRAVMISFMGSMYGSLAPNSLKLARFCAHPSDGPGRAAGPQPAPSRSAVRNPRDGTVGGNPPAGFSQLA